MAIQRELCRINEVYERNEGEVYARVHFASGRKDEFPVLFSPLLEWRLNTSDETISRMLRPLICTVWIEQGRIVQVQTVKQGTEADGESVDDCTADPTDDSSALTRADQSVGHEPGSAAAPAKSLATIPTDSRMLWTSLVQAERIAVSRAQSEEAKRALEADLEDNESGAAEWDEYKAWVEISEACYPDAVRNVAQRYINRLAESINKKYPGVFGSSDMHPVYPRSISLLWTERQLEGAIELLLPIPVAVWGNIRSGENEIEEALAMRFIWSLSKWQQAVGGDSQFLGSEDHVFMRIEGTPAQLAIADQPYLILEGSSEAIPIVLIPANQNGGEEQ